MGVLSYDEIDSYGPNLHPRFFADHFPKSVCSDDSEPLLAIPQKKNESAHKKQIVERMKGAAPSNFRPNNSVPPTKKHPASAKRKKQKRLGTYFPRAHSASVQSNQTLQEEVDELKLEVQRLAALIEHLKRKLGFKNVHPTLCSSREWCIAFHSSSKDTFKPSETTESPDGMGEPDESSPLERTVVYGANAGLTIERQCKPNETKRSKGRTVASEKAGLMTGSKKRKKSVVLLGTEDYAPPKQSETNVKKRRNKEQKRA